MSLKKDCPSIAVSIEILRESFNFVHYGISTKTYYPHENEEYIFMLLSPNQDTKKLHVKE